MREVGYGLIHRCCRHHQPDGARFIELFDQVGQRDGTNGVVLGKIFDHFRRTVKDDAPMPVFDQPSHHVGAHSTQANHPKLHGGFMIHVGAKKSVEEHQNGYHLIKYTTACETVVRR
jgi:hypothetical protein